MTQSIITRYHPVTATRGVRYSANTSSKGSSIMRAPEIEEDSIESHKLVASELADRLGWSGAWQGAALNDKGGMVWVNTSDRFSKDYQFEV